MKEAQTMLNGIGTIKAFRPSLYAEEEEGLERPTIDEVRLANIALYARMASEGLRLFENTASRPGVLQADPSDQPSAAWAGGRWRS
jgi:hypothetical protein